MTGFIRASAIRTRGWKQPWCGTIYRPSPALRLLRRDQCPPYFMLWLLLRNFVLADCCRPRIGESNKRMKAIAIRLFVFLFEDGLTRHYHHYSRVSQVHSSKKGTGAVEKLTTPPTPCHCADRFSQNIHHQYEREETIRTGDQPDR